MDTLLEYVQWLVEQAPWFVLALFALPFALLARFGRIAPRAQTVVLLTIPFVVGVLAIIIPATVANTTAQTRTLALFAALLVGILDTLILLIITVDLFLLPSKKEFTAKREMQRAASIAMPHPVELTIDYRGRWPVSLRVKDDAPEGTKLSPDEHVIRLGARGSIRFQRTNAGLMSWRMCMSMFDRCLGFGKRTSSYLVAVHCMSIPI
jgi:hypothetical protein